MATNIPYGSPLANKLQSAGLFAANMQRNTTINRLTGKFPQQAESENTMPADQHEHAHCSLHGLAEDGGR